MGADVLRFVERVVEDYGPVKVIVWPLAILSALTTLGVLSGGSATQVALQLFVVVTVVVVVVSLGLRNRQLRASIRSAEKSAIKYAERVIENEGLDYEIISWSETQRLSKNEWFSRRDVAIRVGDSAPLLLFWLKTEPPAFGPTLDEKGKAKVRVSVRQMNDGEVGARMPAILTWDGEKPYLLIDFHGALEPGAEMTIRHEMHWPRRSGSVEDRVAHLSYTYHRPVGTFALSMTLSKDLNLRTATVRGVDAPTPTVKSVDGDVVIDLPEWRPTDAAPRFTIAIDPQR